MNMRTSAAGIAAAGMVTLVLTLDQMREIAQKALDDKGDARFNTLHGFEHINAEDVVGIPTKGTALEPIVTALRSHGVEVTETFGSVMKTLQLTQDDVHSVVCSCDKENRHTMEACEAAGWFAYTVSLKAA